MSCPKRQIDTSASHSWPQISLHEYLKVHKLSFIHLKYSHS